MRVSKLLSLMEEQGARSLQNTTDVEATEAALKTARMFLYSSLQGAAEMLQDEGETVLEFDMGWREILDRRLALDQAVKDRALARHRTEVYERRRGRTGSQGMAQALKKLEGE